MQAIKKEFRFIRQVAPCMSWLSSDEEEFTQW